MITIKTQLNFYIAMPVMWWTWCHLTCHDDELKFSQSGTIATPLIIIYGNTKAWKQINAFVI